MMSGELSINDPHSPPRRDAIHTAARLIRRGGLVTFPTETVYGPGADALQVVRWLVFSRRRAAGRKAAHRACS